MRIIFVAAFLAALSIVPAQAKHHRVTALTSGDCQFTNEGRQICSGVISVSQRSYRETRLASYDDGRVIGHPAGCPHTAFCGCGVSVKVFGHPVRNLYLAANWLKYPRATPGPGMVAARHGHVMYIESLDANGNAVVYDPNSGGHQTRIHTRSLAGYAIVNPHG